MKFTYQLLTFVHIIFLNSLLGYPGSYRFFPEKNLYIPNFSNPLEARIGAQFFTENNNVELMIGSVKDLFHYQTGWRTVSGFGVEFFNWTRLDRKENFKFPVLAVDYFFGGYLVFRYDGWRIHWINRFRVSHISAHLADGSYNIQNSQWNKINPFVYSREFVEWNSNIIYKNLRTYFTASYILHSVPKFGSKTIIGIGAEAIIKSFHKNSIHLFVGFDLKFQKYFSNKINSNNNFAAGLILGNPMNSNFRIAYQYYNGYSLHGEFFKDKEAYSVVSLSLVL